VWEVELFATGVELPDGATDVVPSDQPSSCSPLPLGDVPVMWSSSPVDAVPVGVWPVVVDAGGLQSSLSGPSSPDLTVGVPVTDAEPVGDAVQESVGPVQSSPVSVPSSSEPVVVPAVTAPEPLPVVVAAVQEVGDDSTWGFGADEEVVEPSMSSSLPVAVVAPVRAAPSTVDEVDDVDDEVGSSPENLAVTRCATAGLELNDTPTTLARATAPVPMTRETEASNAAARFVSMRSQWTHSFKAVETRH
jgi:hypothetical protein